MDTPHLVHLIIVGIVFLLVLISVAVILRKIAPRSWWMILLLPIVLPVAWQVGAALLR